MATCGRPYPAFTKTPMKLRDKVAIVCGPIQGIGLSVGLDLARHGTRCVLPYYDWLDSLEAMHQKFMATGTEYHALPVDLRTRDGALQVVDAALNRFGRLDILINNIERGGWPVVHGSYTREQWELEFHTTITAKWHLFQEALPWLRASGDGAVVNLSSIAGLVGRCGPAGLVFHDCYSLANRSIQSLTEIWAREGAPEVRVNELMLGFFDMRHGPGTRGWGILTQDQRESILGHTLLHRTGKGEEVARAVRFLVSEATFMTGAVLRMDGGYILGGDTVSPLPSGAVTPGESTFGGAVSPPPDMTGT